MGLDSGYTNITRTCYNDTSKGSVEKIDVYLYLRTRKTLPHNAKSLQTLPSPRLFIPDDRALIIEVSSA
jgi:hypothetical protein